ncbi:MAG: ribosomal-protein-alanine N-acetyltransferase [Acidobacteria bacterium]|nr:MAG: ribosomal-protein-alanine N-acetyltransferase [Acidobacteriota bacterium]
MNIRRATLADIPSMMHLDRHSPAAAHWTQEQYRQAFQHEGPDRLLLVAESSSGILGFLVALHLAPEWELENIVVAPTSRREGIGKRLLNTLLAAANETNSSAVFLEVRDSNAAAQTFYEEAGFNHTGRRKSYYTDPAEDAVLYRLTLN